MIDFSLDYGSIILDEVVGFLHVLGGGGEGGLCWNDAQHMSGSGREGRPNINKMRRKCLDKIKEQCILVCLTLR